MLRPGFQHPPSAESSPQNPPLLSPPSSTRAVQLTVLNSPQTAKQQQQQQQRGGAWGSLPQWAGLPLPASAAAPPRALGALSAQSMPAETVRAPRVLAGWRRWAVTRWGKANIVDPGIAVFSSGVEPKMLAFSLALGLVLGLFPLCGTNSALCVLVSLILRSSCHAPTMLFAVFAATPLELGMIVPYVRLGEALLYLDRAEISPSAIFGALRGQASGDLLLRLLGSVVAWLLTAPLLLWVSYHLLLPIASMTRRGTAGGSQAPAVSPREA